jgi:D-sedoheptulose 7-phosphate isomerase
LLAVSTSGNARNVVLAAKAGLARGMAVVAMTGRDGGALRALAHVVLAVPEQETFRVQELHLPIYHCLCAMLEARFFTDQK